MTKLVAMLTSGNWSHVSKLADEENWENAILVTNQQGKSTFKCNKQCEFIVIDEEWPVSQMIETIRKGLSKEYGEVGLNFVSGNGKEHMALIAGVIQAGLSFRLVAITKEGIKEL